ncbi:MAG: TetR/AcrR family transcriptional regulator [Spirochaetales bacterium]|nr:TetR/AcrR family transcriptional regulator [Spirochaetales bacterium]
MTKQSDIRIQRTKQAIKNTLKDMILQLPYEKITIKALTQQAQINRNTFYLHYESLDDVLYEIQQNYTDKFMQLTKDYSFIDNQDELVKSFFTFMESQDDFFIKVTCDSRFDYIRERMQKKVTSQSYAASSDKSSSNRAIMNILREYSNVTLYLYRQWVTDGRQIPLDRMITLVSQLLNNGMNGAAKMIRER